MSRCQAVAPGAAATTGVSVEESTAAVWPDGPVARPSGSAASVPDRLPTATSRSSRPPRGQDGEGQVRRGEEARRHRAGVRRSHHQAAVVRHARWGRQGPRRRTRRPVEQLVEGVRRIGQVTHGEYLGGQGRCGASRRRRWRTVRHGGNRDRGSSRRRHEHDHEDERDEEERAEEQPDPPAHCCWTWATCAASSPLKDDSVGPSAGPGSESRMRRS